MTSTAQLLELKKELAKRFTEGYRRLVGYSNDGLPPTYISNEKHTRAMDCLKDIIAQQKSVDELLVNQSDSSIIIEIPKDADQLYVKQFLSGVKPLPKDWKLIRKGELLEPANIYEIED